MSGKLAERITVTGVVQGIGFRPFLRALAERYGLAGEVRNRGGIVEVLAVGERRALDRFAASISAEAPPGAAILSVLREAVPETDGKGRLPCGDAFRITVSEADGEEGLPLFAPDLGICGACARELEDPADRRYRYPLISCVGCGPRHTVAEAFPYDRERTVLRRFSLCPACAAEYGGRAGEMSSGAGPHALMRRRHAQTISCRDCGPQVRWLAPDGRETAGDEAMERAAALLRQGRVVALKGLGGFQLMCAPGSRDGVRWLRERKGREAKPFALLFAELEEVRRYCLVSPAEAALLTSPARPIALLVPRGRDAGEVAARAGWSSAVLGDSAFLGAMLPSTGMQRMLARELGPLIVTSANRSGAPMDIGEASFREHFPGVGVLSHDREILAPVDDSVAYVDAGGTARLVRRARGYVPLPVLVPASGGGGKGAGGDVLAFGGDLKATFAFARGDRIIASQPFGDLEEATVRRAFLAELERLLGMYGLRPGSILCDAHPGYHSGAMAEEWAERLGLTAPVRVYHHHAHVLAVMAEYGLSSCLGIALDGTGYGPDGSIWGGELLWCRGARFDREWHLPALRIPGGDAAARDAELAAAALLVREGAGLDALALDDRKRETILAALRTGIGVTESSSAGRQFDAMACILGIGRRNRFEGECAMALEAAAHRWLRGGCREEDGRGRRAFGFHQMLARAFAGKTAEAAARRGERRVVLAGGCFANRLLLALLREALEGLGLLVYVPARTPVGDGGIAVGQAYYGMLA